MKELKLSIFNILDKHIKFYSQNTNQLSPKPKSSFRHLKQGVHSNEIPKGFAVDVKERQNRLPTMYWLPKLHKRPYKARFIANSSSCTTTELLKFLTSCLTAIKA